MKTEQVMQHLVGKTYKEVVESLRVESDQGDCCGWSECAVSDMVKEIEGASDARLKHVVRIDYPEDEDEGERVVVNFIFDIGWGDGAILGYDMSAGSGSGWGYGAWCKLMHGDEEIASVDY